MSQTSPRRGHTRSCADHDLIVAVDMNSGRITLTGRLDRKTAHHLLDAVRTLSGTSHTQWIINAAELHSCDSTGVRALSASYRRALRQGARLTISAAHPSLRAALSAVKLDTHVVNDLA